MGPFRKVEGSNKDGYPPVAHLSKEATDMYSKVYVRQRHAQYKAPSLETVEEETQLVKEDNEVDAIEENQVISPKQRQFDVERRLKSIIACNTNVLEEAQQQWNFGKVIGLEADIVQSDYIHNFANMESRDRKEAMELGNRKIHR